MRPLFILCILLLTVGARAQLNDLSFRKLTTNEGLSNNFVVDMLQDDKGFLWIATHHGLDRYDGVQVVNYPGKEGGGLADPNIMSVVEDQNHTLWVLNGSGLSWLNTDQGNILQEVTDKQGLYGYVMPYRLYIDHRQQLWMMCSGAIVCYRITGPGTLVLKEKFPLTHPYEGYYNFMTQDRHGNYYFASDRAFYTIDSATHRLREVTFTNQPVPGYNQPLPIRCCYIENDTTFWLGAYAVGGVMRYNPQSGRVVSFRYAEDGVKHDVSKNMVRDIRPDALDPEYLWVGTYDNGLLHLRKRDFHYYAYLYNALTTQGLSNSNVRRIYNSPNGIMFIGTEHGLNILDPQMQAVQAHYCSFAGSNPRKDIINVVLPDDDYRRNHLLWICSNGNGLFRYNQEDRTFKQYKLPDPDLANYNLRQNELFDVVEDVNDQRILWLACGRGLYSFNKQTEIFVPVPEINAGFNNDNRLDKLESYPDGLIACGSFASGFYLYRPATGKITHFMDGPNNHGDHPTNRILSFIRCTDGRFILSEDDAILAIIDPATGQETHWVCPPGTPKFPVTGISDFCLLPGNKLLSAGAGGVWETDLNTHVSRPFASSRHPELGYINNLAADSKGNLWMVANTRLAYYVPSTDRFYIFGSEAGFEQREFYYRINLFHDTTLFVGQTGYFIQADIGRYVGSMKTPDIRITGLRLVDQEEPLLFERGNIKALTISYKQNIISINFAALCFGNNKPVQYAYKLEGLNDDWIYCGNLTNATFTNLDGGHYTFLVKAYDASGSWATVPASLHFYVWPPWWKTWWFRLLVVIGMASLVYLVYRIRIYQLLKLERLRSSIARDLHDDIGSTLSSISMLSEVASRQSATQPEKNQQVFARIADSSNKMMGNMSDIIWSINPDNDRLENMSIRMQEYLHETLEQKEINYRFRMEDQLLNQQLPLDKRRDFYLIFKEAINNSAKYSQAGMVNIQVSRQGRTLVLKIEDDGVGFDPATAGSGNGLKNFHRRAAKMQAQITISSAPGKGTTVTLELPVT